MAQNERKMLKAHVKFPDSEYGLQGDYHFVDFMDFLIQLEVDLPIPELKVTSIKLGHVYKHLLVAQVECTLLNSHFQYELKENDEFEISAHFDEYKLELKTMMDSDMNGKFEGKLDIPDIIIELGLMNENKNWEGNFWMNGVKHVFLQNSESTNTLTLEVQDVLYPTGKKIVYICTH